MKPKHKRFIKRIVIINITLLLSVTFVANSDFFAVPVTFLAENFGKASASIVLPHGDSNKENRTNKIQPTNKKSNKVQSETQTEKQPKNDKTDNKTALASAGEVAGRILSQTIDKSGATMSYGDIYIRNDTNKSFNIKELLNKGPELEIEQNSDKPQVLLVHTHATECFFPSLSNTYKTSWGERDNDINKNMVAVGKVVKTALEKASINTVQSQVLHDKSAYTGSYDRSRETIKEYIKKYPSIKVVLDLHRDAINEDDGDKIRPIISIDNKTAGQIMLIAGCETGSITGYPNWRKNLRFALKLQDMLEKTYPSFARPLYFAEKKYNQDLCKNCILVEVGSQANLIEEAKYSAELFSKVLIKCLKNYS